LTALTLGLGLDRSGGHDEKRSGKPKDLKNAARAKIYSAVSWQKVIPESGRTGQKTLAFHHPKVKRKFTDGKGRILPLPQRLWIK
jgi:hypothetical protein